MKTAMFGLGRIGSRSQTIPGVRKCPRSGSRATSGKSGEICTKYPEAEDFRSLEPQSESGMPVTLLSWAQLMGGQKGRDGLLRREVPFV